LDILAKLIEPAAALHMAHVDQVAHRYLLRGYFPRIDRLALRRGATGCAIPNPAASFLTTTI
jgi:hypothetical protein